MPMIPSDTSDPAPTPELWPKNRADLTRWIKRTRGHCNHASVWRKIRTLGIEAAEVRHPDCLRPALFYSEAQGIQIREDLRAPNKSTIAA